MRFEYSLKREKFAKAKNRGDGFDILWANFEKTIEDNFNRKLLSSVPFKSQVDWLLLNCPKVQVFRNESFEWDPISQENKPKHQLVAQILRTIRNNLFHGGKFEGGLIHEDSRNLQLIICASKTLEDVIQMNSRVLMHYNAIDF